MQDKLSKKYHRSVEVWVPCLVWQLFTKYSKMLWYWNIRFFKSLSYIRSERKCTNCSKGDIEDEKHFIVECPLYENIGVNFFDKVIDLCPNFRYMDTSSKFVWLFTNEHEQVLKKLGSFIEECFLLQGHNWSYRYH